jgi:hypothetical protein
MLNILELDLLKSVFCRKCCTRDVIIEDLTDCVISKSTPCSKRMHQVDVLKSFK